VSASKSSTAWRDRSRSARVAITALFLGWLGFALICVPAGLLLLCSSVTANGRLCALSALLLSFAPLAFFRHGTRKWAWFGLVVAFALVLFVAFRSPPFTDQDGAFQSAPTRSATPNFLSPARLVPELDQHLMGANLFGWIDPFIDRQQATELKQVIREVYEPMREDPDFAECGNALHLCYRDMVLGSRPYHQYSYIPESEKPLPVILFLHGSLGNFKGYLWQWKQLAGEQQIAIVAPSFGIGDWNRRHVNQAAETAIAWIENNPHLDQHRVTLAGLSNGGVGVSNAAEHWEKRFERIVYISPVVVGAPGNNARFAKAVGDTPIVVVSGRDDRRVPVEPLERFCDDLRVHDVNVTTTFLPDRDHFLFFSDFDAVRRVLANQQR